MNNTLDLSQLTDDQLRDKLLYHADQIDYLDQILGAHSSRAMEQSTPSDGAPTANAPVHSPPHSR